MTPTTFRDRVCSPCLQGTFTASSNTPSCTAWRTCDLGFGRVEGSTTTDATCSACAAGYTGGGTVACDVADGSAGSLVMKVLAGAFFEFSVIPAGSFLMGSPDTDTKASGNEKPQHPVTLTKPFLLHRTEATLEQFEAVLGRDPRTGFTYGALRGPVAAVSWVSATEFCDALSQLEGVAAGTYGLPTEAQWEYAARAGTTAPTYGNLSDIAWTSMPGSSTPWGGSSWVYPIKMKSPNPWSLYDMLGNVQEWTLDWAGGYGSTMAQTDPSGPASGTYRVQRGGGTWWAVDYSRSAARMDFYGPTDTSGLPGFRPRRTLP
jgi:formylglycine-generating enzyme required for sulfatase activity